MREGSVVMVVGKIDTRISDAPEGEIYGTVIGMNKDSIMVLLSNGLIWNGLKRDAVLQTEETDTKLEEE